MADGICPGNCNRAWRKARAIYNAQEAAYQKALANWKDGDLIPEQPQPPDIEPWYGEPAWCRACQSVIRRELSELDDLAALLAALPPGIRPPVTGQRERVRVSGSREEPSPSPALDALEELAGWLRDWESAARGTDPRPRRGWLATEITTITCWLYAHSSSLLADEGMALDFGAETRRWHRELTSSAHAASAARHQKQPCPRCHLFTLWRTIGEDYIRCVNTDCKRVLTVEEYERETAVTLA
jgi:hypothetical protein